MNSAVHLTEEQIDDLLIGDLTESAAAHLFECEYCLARFKQMEDAIGSFKIVSLAWSERQSATLPVRVRGVRVQPARDRRAVWVATATAALCVGVAIPLVHHSSPAAPVQTEAEMTASAPAQTFSAAREEQIAQDNQMMQAIDREIGTPVSSPSETFGLESSSSSQRATHGAVQD